MAKNLTKKDIIQSIYEELGKKESTSVAQNVIRDIVGLTFENLGSALARGQDVELRNFGVFELQIRKARVGRNPQKPEVDVSIPRRAVIKFKAGKELKASLAKLKLPKGDAPAAPAKAAPAAKAPAKAAKKK